MKIRMIETGENRVAVVNSDTPIINDGQSALDFAVNMGYEHDCRHTIVSKGTISEDFFRLSTGLAGEVAQKFINYGYRLAIVGDFSGYTSKPLRGYIYECNRGGHLFFVNDEDEALKKLEG